MIQRLGHLVEQVTAGPGDAPESFLALESIESRTGALIEDTDLPRRTPEPSGMTAFREGDVLFGKLRPYLAKSWRADRRGICSTELIVMRPRPSVEGRWLAYLAQSDPLIEWAVATSEGVKMPRTSWEKLRLLEVRTPRLVEQRAVADYLDAETSRMDALASRYKELVDRLVEKRGALTLQGVSGQPMTRPSKPSALPWLTTIPSHWAEVRLTLVARLGSGHTPSREHPEWWTDCTIPWITTGEVWQIRDDRIEYMTETREMISELGIANSSAALHPAGTVVLSRTASAGYSASMGTDLATSQDYVTWTCGPRLRQRFLLLCLRAMREDLLGRLAMGSTHQTIYLPDIQSIRIPLPPLEEQDHLVEWIWARLRRIDAAVDAIRRQIAHLTERRQALITAAVTGQLEVPGVAA